MPTPPILATASTPSGTITLFTHGLMWVVHDLTIIKQIRGATLATFNQEVIKRNNGILFKVASSYVQVNVNAYSVFISYNTRMVSSGDYPLTPEGFEAACRICIKISKSLDKP